MPKTLGDYYELGEAANGRIIVKHKEGLEFDKKLFADFFNTIIQTKEFKNRLVADITNQQLYLVALASESIPIPIVNKVITAQGNELLKSSITLVNNFKFMLELNAPTTVTTPAVNRINLEPNTPAETNHVTNRQVEGEQAILALRFRQQQEENARNAQIPTVSGPPRKPGSPIVVQDHVTRSFNWPWERCTYLGFREGIFIIPPSDRTATALSNVLIDLRTLNKASLNQDTILIFRVNNRAGVFLHNQGNDPVVALLTLNTWLSSIGKPQITLNEIFASSYFMSNNVTNAGEFVPQLRALTNPLDPNIIQALQDSVIVSIPNEVADFINNLRSEELSPVNNNNNNNNLGAASLPLAANARLANIYQHFQWDTLRYFKFGNGIFICSAVLNITPGALDQKLQKLRTEARDEVISFTKCVNGVFIKRRDRDDETINVEERFNNWLKNRNQPRMMYEKDYGEMIFENDWTKRQPIINTLPPIPSNVQVIHNNTQVTDNRSRKRQRNPLTFTDNTHTSRPNTNSQQEPDTSTRQKHSKH